MDPGRYTTLKLASSLPPVPPSQCSEPPVVLFDPAMHADGSEPTIPGAPGPADGSAQRPLQRVEADPAITSRMRPHQIEGLQVAFLLPAPLKDCKPSNKQTLPPSVPCPPAESGSLLCLKPLTSISCPLPYEPSRPLLKSMIPSAQILLVYSVRRIPFGCKSMCESLCLQFASHCLSTLR